MSTSPSQSPGERLCPGCGAAFTCDVEAGKDGCWCFGLPQIAPLDEPRFKGCLCPDCLQKTIETIQARSNGAVGNNLHTRRNLNDGS